MARTLRILATVAAAATSVTGAAQAKGPIWASVCGASGCATLSGESVWPLISWWYTPFTLRAAPKPAPHYSIRLRDPTTGTRWSLVYVPSRHAVRFWQSSGEYGQAIGPYWRSVPRAATAGFDRAVRGVKPYPRSSRWPP